MSAILKFDFQKGEQLRFSEVNYLNYKKKTQFCMWQLHFPLKQGETRTSHGPILHPLSKFSYYKEDLHAGFVNLHMVIEQTPAISRKNFLRRSLPDMHPKSCGSCVRRLSLSVLCAIEKSLNTPNCALFIVYNKHCLFLCSRLAFPLMFFLPRVETRGIIEARVSAPVTETKSV